MSERHPTGSETTVRLDKWLWAARFFKTRALATESISGGKVRVNGLRPKPARAIRVGDVLTIRRGPYEFVVEVRGLSTVRGPATRAVLLYQETEDSRLARERLAEQRRLAEQATPRSPGRPSKKDRRRIVRLTGKGH